MTKTIELKFNAFPSVLKMYPKMMTSKKPSLLKEGKTYPRIEATISSVTADPQHVNQFATVCGFSKNSETLPLPYPHILAAPLQMAILNHKIFPLKLLGLVHIANSITQYRPIAAQEEMDIECSIEGLNDTPKGQIYTMLTKVRCDNELVWEESMSFLARKKSKGPKPAKSKKTDSSTDVKSGAQVTSWEVPSNMGRKFAKVSGDVNPIHMSNLTAKLFGFKQAIIHGVWSMSRTLAELESDLLKKPKGLSDVRFDVNFKLPVFIPCWVSLETFEEGDNLSFTMKDSAGEKPHMSGSLVYLE